MLHRRVLLVLALVCALGAFAAGAAQADLTPVTTVSNLVSGTVEHPRAVVVGVGYTATEPFPAPGVALRLLTVDLPGFTIINSDGDAQCPYSQVRSDHAHCPVGSQIGQGSLDLANGEHVEILIYKSEGNYLAAWWAGTAPLAISGAGTGAVDPAVNALSIAVPTSIAQPDGAIMYATGAHVDLGLPRPGSAGWLFTTDCSFAFKPSLTVTASDESTLTSRKDANCLDGADLVHTIAFGDTVAGTPSAPKPTGVSVAFTSTPAWPPTSQTGQLDDILLGFDGGVVLGASPAVPSCTAAQVATDDGRCPPGALVGRGVLQEGGTIPLTAYNAPGGKGLNILAATPSRYVLEATLDASGQLLKIPIPRGISVPGIKGLWEPLSSFKLDLGDATATSWVRSTGCATGTWSVLTAMDDMFFREQATRSVACTPAPPPGGGAPSGGGGTGKPVVVPPPVTPRPVTGAGPTPLVARFLPSFVTRVRRHGTRLGTFYGLAGMDEVARGSTIDVRCARACGGARSFAVGRALKRSTRLLLRRPVPVTGRTIVEVRVRKRGALGRSAQFVFKRVGSMLLAHRISSGCVTSQAPFVPATCAAGP